MLAKRVVDRCIAQEHRQQQRSETRGLHRKQQRHARGYLDSQYDAGQRRTNDPGEKGGHAHQGEGFRFDVERRE